MKKNTITVSSKEAWNMSAVIEACKLYDEMCCG